MAEVTKTPAAQGDLVTFKVGGRWILAEVVTVGNGGYVGSATNGLGVTFDLAPSTKRWIYPAAQLAEPDKVPENVRALAQRSYATTEEVADEIKRWGAADAEAGEDILEVLT